MKLVLLITIIFGVELALAQNKYSVSTIAPALITNADAVIRYDEQVVTLIDNTKYSVATTLVVTICNKNGEDNFAKQIVYYDNFVKIKQLKAAIYDSIGNKITNLTKQHMSNAPMYYITNEVTDSKQKTINFIKLKKYAYPYTIELSYNTSCTNPMFYPNWAPCSYENVGLEKSLFTITTPTTLGVRYKELNLPTTSVITANLTTTTYTWSVENIVPKVYEAYFNYNEQPLLLIAPTSVNFQNYVSNTATWVDVGNFYKMLNANRDVLPQEIRTKINALVKNETDVLTKIKLVYNYMQSTTRYISIQLGIGGWQTATVTNVAQKGYGDCKALSNYTIALLKEAGITALPALIYAGENIKDIPIDFPSFGFNHVIVCVPLINDTVWLECTSQTEAMGYLGSFTSNRKALVINAEGGHLVNTPHLTTNNNTQHCVATVTVDTLGNAIANATTTYSALLQENVNSLLTNTSIEKQKEALLQSIHIPSFELTKFDFTQYKNRVPVVVETITLTVPKLITAHGATLSLTPSLLHVFKESAITNKNRLSQFYLSPNSYNYTQSDSIIYNFPYEFTMEIMPKSVTITSIFGSYTTSYSIANKQLRYYRKLILASGTFAASSYTSFINFITEVEHNENLKATFTINKKSKR